MDPRPAPSIVVPSRRRIAMSWCPRSVVVVLAAIVGLSGTTPGLAERMCKPALAFKEIRFSPMQEPARERTWSAVLSVDALRCATASGRFEIGFSREKENAMDAAFRAPFTWEPDLVEVSVDFAADEAVGRFWLGRIESCPCREMQASGSGPLSVAPEPEPHRR